jgi:hypothetical protein
MTDTDDSETDAFARAMWEAVPQEKKEELRESESIEE